MDTCYFITEEKIRKKIGGSVGILLKNDLQYKHMTYKSFSSFKLCVVKLYLGNRQSLLLVCIYRILFISITVFLKEIVQLLEILVVSNDGIVIARVVNIHLDKDELYSNNFKDILNMFNIRQHVEFPTHKMGHTSDIIATFYDNPVISNISTEEYDISNHFPVDFDIAAVPEIKGHQTIFYRNLKGNTTNALRDDIS